MSKLADLQKQIFTSLVEEVPMDVNALKNKFLSVEQSLAIYRNSFRAALLNAMREVYEVCVKLVGDEFFNAMAMDYIKQTPSYSENIGHYGEEFSAFIANFPHTKDLPYLSDVAHLEWAWYQALHAENVRPFNSAGLAALSEEAHEHIVFTLPPSMTLLESDYPIHEIWRLNQMTVESNDTVDLGQGGVKLAVWRHEMDMRMDVLAENEWVLLQAIAHGVSMGELDGVLGEAELAHVSDLLAQFVRAGWIAGWT